MKTGLLSIVTLLAVLVIAGTLYVFGQPWICKCGYVSLWSGNIFSSGNSQHIADWYTLSHIFHGVLIGLLGRFVLPKSGFNLLFLFAAFTGIAWEIIEHTDFVLNRFRIATINQGYFGDSILNAVSDYLFMTIGFLFAFFTRRIIVIAAIFVLELTAGFVGRDNLTLTTIMLIHPVESIKAWQEEIKPDNSDGTQTENATG